uniref:S-methyl-5'-thioadenosine phosphorylase-like n=1 Tax=Styela clava TaxID=7725 RepID=UPI001939DCA5|nr:S-methyl-5'-thioadenosine phosphorylase-like [Styela clava]
MSSDIKVGIIGGTGLNNPDILENRVEKEVNTSYGKPSDTLVCGTISGIKCVILSRHGHGHSISPTLINFRANICALKEEGCTHILATSACGSLKEEIAPGHFVIMDQFIDRTFNRHVTFYDQQPGSWKGVSHIPMGEPFSPYIGKILTKACKENGVIFHPNGTTVTIEGPRFSTVAESNIFRSWNADLVNMTTVPEVTLAKEAGLMYGVLGMATDYDCWKKHEEAVSVESVMAVMKKNSEMGTKILKTAVRLIAEYGDWTKEIKEAQDVATKSIML